MRWTLRTSTGSRCFARTRTTRTSSSSALYDDTVYHHGAGFRRARGGRLKIAESGVHEANNTVRAKVLRALPDTKWARKLRRKYNPARKINLQLKEETDALSAEWFEKIERDPEFYRELM